MGLYESKETAAFNLALPYLTRINAILNSNYNVFKKGDAPMFLINLRQLYRELDPWLKKDNKVDEKTPVQELFSELSKIPKTDKQKIWGKMEEIEMKLREHFKTLGMLMPKISDPRFLFGNKQR